MEESYTNTVLQAISRALNEGIDNTGLAVFITAIIIILIIAIPVFLRIKNRKQVEQSSDASFHTLIRKHNLTILELDLIDKISETLRRPEEKYLLLLNHSKLRQAAHRTEDLTEAEIELLENLKIKLGFVSSAGDGSELTTRRLKQGTPVKLQTSELNWDSAEVYSSAESNITIKHSNGKEPVIPDREYLTALISDGKPRLFRLIPDKVRNELFSAPHVSAEQVDKLKARIGIYIEGKMPKLDDAPDAPSNHALNDEPVESLPILQTETEKVYIHSKIVLLSENGAFITDIDGRLLPEMQLSITLDNGREQGQKLEAVVLRTSREKKLASIRFTEPQETDDQI